MNSQNTQLVISQDGLRGHVLQQIAASDGQPARVLIRFDNGQQALVARDDLELQGDGSFYLAFDTAGLKARSIERQHESRVLPVIEEELHVERRTRTTGVVQIRKLVHEHEELVDQPLLRESVEVVRVPINQLLAQGDAASQLRHDGETMIIPVLEEVLVVEKRLMLKEELHITRRRSEARDQQRVTLRSEELVVEQVAPEESREVAGKDLA